MGETIYVSFDPNLDEGLAPNLQSCHTWEVVCTEEFQLPVTICTPLEAVEVQSPVQPVVTKRKKASPDLSSQKGSPLNSKTAKGCSGEGKELGPDCGCPIKCFKKLGEETINKIFQDFWALEDYNSQNAYLFGLINIIGVKRRYTKNETSRRNFTIVYHINDKGKNVPICKKAFLNIHGLQRNMGRINNLANKIKEGECVPPFDQRGRHNNRPNGYSEEAIEHVRRHLLLCPKIDWKKNPSKASKQMMFSTKHCYSLYVNEYCKSNELTPVSLDKFRRVFATEGYKRPCRVVEKSEK